MSAKTIGMGDTEMAMNWQMSVPAGVSIQEVHCGLRKAEAPCLYATFLISNPSHSRVAQVILEEANGNYCHLPGTSSVSLSLKIPIVALAR